MLNPDSNHQNKLDKNTSTLRSPSRVLWMLTVLFILIILGSLAGIVVFRNVLRPGQQQRVISILPFTELFLPKRSDTMIALPTPRAQQTNAISPADLLDLSLDDTASEVEGSDITEEPSAVPTFSSATKTPTLSTIEPTKLTFVTPVPTTQAIVSYVTASPPPGSGHLYGFKWLLQTWNNCGPASITIALSYFGWTQGQEVAAAFLRPDSEDKNVSRGEMVNFVNQETDIRAVTRMGGNTELLKAFISNDFPVIISSGFMPEGEDWLGHYQTIVGYNDGQQIFYVYDSFLGTGENGEGMRIPYADLDQNWQQFNRDFIVLFRPKNEQRIASLLGDLADINTTSEYALTVAQNEARANPKNGFAWFNMGTAFVALKRYKEAAQAYDQARRLNIPWRMLWYQFGPYESYFETGRYDDVLALVAANLINGGQYVEETYYWQGRVFAAQGRNKEAVDAFRQAIAHNPSYEAARAALGSLEQ